MIKLILSSLFFLPLTWIVSIGKATGFHFILWGFSIYFFIKYLRKWLLDYYKKSDDLIAQNQNMKSNAYDYNDPLDFERWCCDVLNERGWKANLTPINNDYGVDVLAEKQGQVFALQCKLHSSPIGIKAVQEIYSGREYYGADLGAVIAVNGFTSSAIELANTTGIRLITPDELMKA